MPLVAVLCNSREFFIRSMCGPDLGKKGSAAFSSAFIDHQMIMTSFEKKNIPPWTAKCSASANVALRGLKTNYYFYQILQMFFFLKLGVIIIMIIYWSFFIFSCVFFMLIFLYIICMLFDVRGCSEAAPNH